MIGDKDPEDAWDDGDPVHVRLALLVRIVAGIAADGDVSRAERRRLDALRLIRKVALELGGR
jgi:hypothetical protein